MKRIAWLALLTVAAALLIAWHGIWFVAGGIAGYGWTIAIIAAESARAGFRVARGTHYGTSLD